MESIAQLLEHLYEINIRHGEEDKVTWIPLQMLEPRLSTEESLLQRVWGWGGGGCMCRQRWLSFREVQHWDKFFFFFLKVNETILLNRKK